MNSSHEIKDVIIFSLIAIIMFLALMISLQIISYTELQERHKKEIIELMKEGSR